MTAPASNRTPVIPSRLLSGYRTNLVSTITINGEAMKASSRAWGPTAGRNELLSAARALLAAASAPGGHAEELANVLAHFPDAWDLPSKAIFEWSLLVSAAEKEPASTRRSKREPTPNEVLLAAVKTRG